MGLDVGIYSGLLAPPTSMMDYANQHANFGLLPLRRQLMESQVQDAASNSQLRSAQVAQMQRQQSMIEGLLGSSPQSAPTQPSLYPAQSKLSQAAAFGMQPGPTNAAAALPSQPEATQPWSTSGNPPSSRPSIPPAQNSQPYGGMDQRMLAYDVAFNGGKGLAGFINDRTKPTPEQLNATYAFPNDPSAARSAVEAQVAKAGYIPPVNARPGSIIRDPRTNMPMAFNPHVPDGYVPTFDASGNVTGLQPIAGAAQAMTTVAQAGSLGHALGEIRSGVDGGNMPTYVTGLPPGTVIGGGSLAGGGMPAVAPNAAGRPSVPPQAQAAMDTDARAILNQELVKSTQSLLTATASGDTAGAARARSDIDALHRELSLRGAPGPASAAVLPSQIQAPTMAPSAAVAPASAAGAPIVRPSLPAGQADYADTQGRAAGNRYNDVLSQAKDSPMRVNVLDNIIGLSKAGVATGPTQDFKNKVLGIIGDATGNGTLQGKVADYNELSKFLQQNAIRAWQAAGGTGTDSQLEQSLKANPNSTMMPQAVQAMAAWAKAGELAMQAKANVMQTVNPTTPQAQAQFETKWRQAFDPRAFQLISMTPQERATFIGKQPDQAALKLHIQQLMQMGAL